MSAEAFRPTPEKDRAPLTVTEVLVAGNRGPCGGVNMAIEAVNQVLDIVDGRQPVYTNWDVVNNNPVMERLTSRGLINVRNNWALVPDESIMFFSAHGVPPLYHKIAAQKNFLTIDVTCQLVTRVHTEVKTAEQAGKHVIYIGTYVDIDGKKVKHPETVGVLGELKPKSYTFIEPATDVNTILVPDNKEIVVYSQTTLSTDEVKKTQVDLKERFNARITIPNRWDICYATDNRQQAVDDLLNNRKVDFLLVGGSSHSHNSQELARKADAKGIPSALVDNPHEIQRDWFTQGVQIVGATSGASEMEPDFQKILDFFRAESIDPIVYVPQVVPEKFIVFKLPQQDIQALEERIRAA